MMETKVSDKKDKKSPFDRWTQFNNKHTRELMSLSMKYPRAQAILFFLVDQMDEYNACVCSYKAMQDMMGCSESTITRSIKILKDLGFIAILKSGNANVYTINDKVYWKSYGKNVQYSKFPANVVLTKSEQEINYKKLKKLKLVSVTE